MVERPKFLSLRVLNPKKSHCRLRRNQVWKMSLLNNERDSSVRRLAID